MRVERVHIFFEAFEYRIRGRIRSIAEVGLEGCLLPATGASAAVKHPPPDKAQPFHRNILYRPGNF